VELASPLRIVSLVEETQRIARVDPLTSLLNRRACLQELTSLLAHRGLRRRYVTLLDVDHFKHINDRFGHAAGDRCLVAIGAALSAHAREGRIAARWGGEEFLMVFEADDDAAALREVESLRAEVGAIELGHEGQRIPISASFGVAARLDPDTQDRWIDRADRAMYRAKVGGRNRVVLALPDEGDEAARDAA
jgi:diguanylate cyclase (GGDEF)-like protein